MRQALIIEYDGSAFSGWQRQPDARSVQSCVESALSKVADHEVQTICAGRTDAGVHALGQVIHFDTDATRSARSWCLGANTHLPSDVSVVWAGAVADDFSARYSAVERSYRYRILNCSNRAALQHRRAWFFPEKLDVERMRLATRALLGKHDFSAFRAANCQARTAVREVSRAELDACGDEIVLHVSANAFLMNMVRIITGVLVTIGTGEQAPQWVEELISHGDRTRSGLTAPPEGLYLVQVRYPAQHAIPMRSGTCI